MAEGVARTCHEMSARQPTGVAPEFISVVPGNDFVNGASHNLLRPEVNATGTLELNELQALTVVAVVVVQALTVVAVVALQDLTVVVVVVL